MGPQTERDDEDVDSDWLNRTRHLVGELGGEFEILEAEEDPDESVPSFAYQRHVTQIVWESLCSPDGRKSSAGRSSTA